MVRWALLCCALAAVCAAQSKTADACVPPPAGVAPPLPARLMTGQGKVHFPITTSDPKAQEFFDQGVAQMHSFWSNEAERSFLQAAQLDPEAPMPRWGIAMVAAGDYRPRFQLDLQEEVWGKRKAPRTRADDAAEKAVLLSQVDGRATDLEKMYIAAVAARRNRALKDPDQAYIDALRAIAAKYPKEIEARLYLTLHLMRGYTLPGKQPRPGTMEAVEMLRALLKEAPDHPGIHHYIIHGWEGSSFAQDAWTSCERYAELVPNIPHALHMPGHIYSQTGRWEDAARYFQSAAQNELGYMKADALYGRGHHGHNVHYLATAYSFSGDYDKAKAAARSLLEFTENPREAKDVDNFRTAYRQGWFALMRTLVQSEAWAEILNGALPVYDKPRETAWRHWSMGLAQAAGGEAAEARKELAAMRAAMENYKVRMSLPAPAELRVAQMELEGHIEAAAGSLPRAHKLLDKASRAERVLTYSEPPMYPRPVAEAMGEWMLRTGDAAQAESAFRTALEQYPASARAKRGLREALKRENKPLEAGLY
jgi:tetratricopeptide (TPR) repeat protein